METKHSIEIKAVINLTDEQISDLLVTAFEGGINYWCGKVNICHVPEEAEGKFKYASDLIALGGELELVDCENPKEKLVLTLSKFLNGVKSVCENYGFTSAEELIDNHDALTADEIIQYAVFDEIVYV